jgi:hypothetical protein
LVLLLLFNVYLTCLQVASTKHFSDLVGNLLRCVFTHNAAGPRL